MSNTAIGAAVARVVEARRPASERIANDHLAAMLTGEKAVEIYQRGQALSIAADDPVDIKVAEESLARAAPIAEPGGDDGGACPGRQTAR